MSDPEMTPEQVKYWAQLGIQADIEKRTARQYSYHIQRRYGMTLEQYDEQLLKQSNACAICKQPPSKKRLGVYQSGAGLLCTRCMVAIRYFNGSVELLNEAIKYIQAIDTPQ